MSVEAASFQLPVSERFSFDASSQQSSKTVIVSRGSIPTILTSTSFPDVALRAKADLDQVRQFLVHHGEKIGLVAKGKTNAPFIHDIRENQNGTFTLKIILLSKGGNQGLTAEAIDDVVITKVQFERYLALEKEERQKRREQKLVSAYLNDHRDEIGLTSEKISDSWKINKEYVLHVLAICEKDDATFEVKIGNTDFHESKIITQDEFQEFLAKALFCKYFNEHKDRIKLLAPDYLHSAHAFVLKITARRDKNFEIEIGPFPHIPGLPVLENAYTTRIITQDEFQKFVEMAKKQVAEDDE